MLKKVAKNTLVISILSSLSVLFTNVALAAGKCSINGQEVPCEELANQAKGFLGWGIGIIILMLIIGVFSTVFWIMMLVHAAKHNVDNKPMWIILMVFTGIVGALIYYFVEKRKFDQQPVATIQTPPATPHS